MGSLIFSRLVNKVNKYFISSIFENKEINLNISDANNNTCLCGNSSSVGENEHLLENTRMIEENEEIQQNTQPRVDVIDLVSQPGVWSCHELANEILTLICL